MSRTVYVTVTRELTYTVAVSVVKERDDDGCGSPNRSGNGMTGCRGTFLAVDRITVADAAALAEAAVDAIEDDDVEIRSALHEAEFDDD